MQRDDRLLWGLLFSLFIHAVLVALSITLLVEVIRWIKDRRAAGRTSPAVAVIAHADDADRTLGG